MKNVLFIYLLTIGLFFFNYCDTDNNEKRKNSDDKKSSHLDRKAGTSLADSKGTKVDDANSSVEKSDEKNEKPEENNKKETDKKTEDTKEKIKEDIKYESEDGTEKIRYFKYFNDDKDKLPVNPISEEDAKKLDKYYKALYFQSGALKKIIAYKKGNSVKAYVYEYKDGKKFRRICFVDKLYKDVLYYDKDGKKYKDWFFYRKDKTKQRVIKYINGIKWLIAQYNKDGKVKIEREFDPEDGSKAYERKYFYYPNGKVSRIDTYAQSPFIAKKYREPDDFFLSSIKKFDKNGKLIKEDYYKREEGKISHTYKYTYKKDNIIRDEFNAKGMHMAQVTLDKNGKFVKKKVIRKYKPEDSI